MVLDYPLNRSISRNQTKWNYKFSNMAAKDYYKTLEVTHAATEKDIKTSYRRLARKYHPDVNPNDKHAEERFKELGEAYEVLSDPEKRRKYDQWGVDWEKYEKAGAASAGWGNGGGYSTKDSGFGDIFDQIFGGKAGARPNTSGRMGFNTNPNPSAEFNYGRTGGPRPSRGEDREQPIDLSLEEAYSGTLRQLQIQSSEICSVCSGSGMKGGNRCSNCSGLGVVPRNKRLEVRIPAGVEEGSKVRVAAEGGSGLHGGPRGDLFLKVHIMPHTVFERTGPDLHTTVTVPLYTAILGGEASVPSPKGGKFILNVPSDTANGKVFRLSGQGMPMINQPATRGDLYVKVNVSLPTSLSQEEAELFRRLRDIRPQ